MWHFKPYLFAYYNSVFIFLQEFISQKYFSLVDANETL